MLWERDQGWGSGAGAAALGRVGNGGIWQRGTQNPGLEGI